MSATKLSPVSHTSAAVPTLIRAADITLARGGRNLFQNVSFTLAAGGVLHLTGPNGTGKTSLLRLLAGALPLQAGQLEHPPGLVAAFLPADDALWQGTVTTRASLSFWARLGGGDVDAALQAFDLTAQKDTPVFHLSAGQKRRLSLARVVVSQARLWLLDEPLAGLDETGRGLFAACLQAHLNGGGAAVIASHEALPSLPGVDITVLNLAGPA